MEDILTVKIIKGIIAFIFCVLIIGFICNWEVTENMAIGMVVVKPMTLKEPIDKQVRQLDLFLDKVTLALQGRISFGNSDDGNMGENMRGQFQVVADTGSADSELTIAHDLGYAPYGFILVKNDKAGVVYESGSAWTIDDVYLKCSAANSNITVFLF